MLSKERTWLTLSKHDTKYTYVAVGVTKNDSIERNYFPCSKNYLTTNGCSNAAKRMKKDPRFKYVEQHIIAPWHPFLSKKK